MNKPCVNYNKFWSPAFDDMGNFVFLLDADFNLVKANESFFKVFGDEKKLVGKKCFEIFHSLKKPFPGCPHGKMLETNVSEKGEFYEPSLKKYLSVTVTPIWGDDHKLVGSIHVAEDVTQLKEEEEKLKIRNDFIDKSMTPFAVGDSQGNLVYVNASCLGLWGYTSSREVVGRPIIEFWKNDENFAEIVNALKNKRGWTGELTAQKKDGTTFDCHVVSNVVEDNSGRHLYRAASFTDITARKRAEEALKKSELMCHAVLDQTFQFIGVLTPDGKLVHANSTALKFAGVNEPDVLGKPFWETPWWRHDRELQDKLRAAVKSASKGQFVRFEANHPAADGGIHYVDFSLKPVKDESGNVKFIIPEGRDITERKQMDEELRLNNEILSLFVRNSPVYAYIKDVTPDQGVVLQASDNFQQMIGIRGSQMVGKTMSELFPGELGRKMIADDWAVVSSGKMLTRDEDFNGRNYTTIKFPIVHEDKTLLAGYTLDITARKKMEEELKESEARYNALLAGAPEGIIAAEIKTRQFRYVNPAMCRMFGYTEEEFMTLGMTDIHPKESLDQVMSEFGAQARGEGLTSHEIPCLRKDGSLFYANVSAIGLVLDGRKCMVGFFTDVTELKRVQDEIHVAKDYTDNIMRSMINALIVVGPDAKIKTVNRATVAFLGYKEDELIGKPVGMIFRRRRRRRRRSVISRFKNEEVNKERLCY